MSGLLEKLKLQESTTDVSEGSSDLESLLLEESKKEKQEIEALTVPKPASEPSGSRKARRKKIKSNRVVAKKAEGKTARTEQKRRQKLYEDRNRRALLKRQKQSNQKSKSGDRSKKLSYQGRVSKEAKKSNKIAEAQRPVVLGTVEFNPCYDRRENLTSSGVLLKMKRAVRRINLDKQVNPKQSDTRFRDPDITKALVSYYRDKEQFLNSLSPSNIKNFEEALSAFGLTLEESVSNSETLYTVMKEYAEALRYGSARLDESSPRSIDSFPHLVKSKDKIIEGMYEALTSSRNSWRDFERALPDDSEVAIKCLLAIMAKEIVYSYNMQKNDFTILDTRPDYMLETSYKRNVLTNPSELTSRDSAHGAVFSSQSTSRPRKTFYNYPFESTEVLPTKKVEARSSITFLKALTSPNNEVFKTRIPKQGTKSFDNPYEASVASYSAANEKISALTSTEELEFGDSMYVGLMNDILSSVLTTLSDAQSSTSSAVQCEILRMAGKDSKMLESLLVYLAFRQDKLSSESESSEYFVEAINRNKKLIDVVGKMDAGTVSKTFTIDPQKITLDPPVDGQSTFEAPSKSTTATVETTPTSFEEGSLEAKMKVSFEQVCDYFARQITNYAHSTSKTSPTFTASKTRRFTMTSLKDTLADLTKQPSLFDYILAFDDTVNSALPVGDTVVKSIFSESSDRTTFSRIFARNFACAFTTTISRLMLVLLDGRAVMESSSSVPNTKPSSSTKTKNVRSKKSSKAIKLIGAKRGKSSKDKDPDLSLSFASDFSSAVSDLQAYLNNEERDFDDIADTYPLVASAGAALLEEEEFLSSFTEGLLDYFTDVSDKFSDVDTSLDKKVGNVSLRRLIRLGLTPSKDLAKIMKSLSFTMNDKNMVYSGVKVNDPTIGPLGVKFILNQMKTDAFRKKTNIFVVGIPSGLLENITTTPAEIGEIRKRDKLSDPKFFTIRAEKIDQVRPDTDYEDLEFTFSRDLFVAGAAKGGSEASFVKIDNELDTSKISTSDAKSQYGNEVVRNHLVDAVLKQYADLQFDLDFSETAFPNEQSRIDEIMSGVVNIPSFVNVDKKSSEFLSSSNLAFDPLQRTPEKFDFYNAEKQQVVLSKQDNDDPYAYSLFDYINSYGAIFNASDQSERLNAGLKFDKVICIMIDDDDFKKEHKVKKRDDRFVNAESAAQDRAEKEVSIGVMTSAGVDLNTYRFSIVMEE